MLLSLSHVWLDRTSSGGGRSQAITVLAQCPDIGHVFVSVRRHNDGNKCECQMCGDHLRTADGDCMCVRVHTDTSIIPFLRRRSKTHQFQVNTDTTTTTSRRNNGMFNSCCANRLHALCAVAHIFTDMHSAHTHSNNKIDFSCMCGRAYLCTVRACACACACACVRVPI